MRRCKEITELVSKDLDKPLGLSEKIAVNLHLLMCSHCRNFRNQTEFIRKAAGSYWDHRPK